MFLLLSVTIFDIRFSRMKSVFKFPGVCFLLIRSVFAIKLGNRTFVAKFRRAIAGVCFIFGRAIFISFGRRVYVAESSGFAIAGKFFRYNGAVFIVRLGIRTFITEFISHPVAGVCFIFDRTVCVLRLHRRTGITRFSRLAIANIFFLFGRIIFIIKTGGRAFMAKLSRIAVNSIFFLRVRPILAISSRGRIVVDNWDSVVINGISAMAANHLLRRGRGFFLFGTHSAIAGKFKLFIHMLRRFENGVFSRSRRDFVDIIINRSAGMPLDSRGGGNFFFFISGGELMHRIRLLLSSEAPACGFAKTRVGCFGHLTLARFSDFPKTRRRFNLLQNRRIRWRRRRCRNWL